MARVHLIRHGQASFGADDYDNLSALGHEQGRVLGAAMPMTGRHLAGSMKRHHQTAQAAGAAPVTDSAWDEFDYMDVIRAHRPDLATPADLRAAFARAKNPNAAFQEIFDAALTRWDSGEHAGDYVESRAQFRARVRAGLDRIAADLPRGEQAFVFTSGGPIAAIAQDLLGLSDAATRDLSRVIVNASVTTIALGRGGPQVLTLNSHHHLERIDVRLVTYR